MLRNKNHLQAYRLEHQRLHRALDEVAYLARSRGESTQVANVVDDRAVPDGIRQLARAVRADKPDATLGDLVRESQAALQTLVAKDRDVFLKGAPVGTGLRRLLDGERNDRVTEPLEAAAAAHENPLASSFYAWGQQLAGTPFNIRTMPPKNVEGARLPDTGTLEVGNRYDDGELRVAVEVSRLTSLELPADAFPLVEGKTFPVDAGLWCEANARYESGKLIIDVKRATPAGGASSRVGRFYLDQVNRERVTVETDPELVAVRRVVVEWDKGELVASGTPLPAWTDDTPLDRVSVDY